MWTMLAPGGSDPSGSVRVRVRVSVRVRVRVTVRVKVRVSVRVRASRRVDDARTRGVGP